MAYTNIASTQLEAGGKSKSSDYNTSAKAVLTLSSSGNTINWKVTMTTSNGPFVFLGLKIGDKKIFWDYYANKPTNYGSYGFVQCDSVTFPRGNGTSKSGSFTYTPGTSGLAVELWVGPSVWYDDSKSADYNAKNRCYQKTNNYTRTYYTEVGMGSTVITDLYNNKFTITATKGKNGTNNTASGPSSLKWGYDTKYSNTYTNGETKTLAIVSSSGATRAVYAQSTTTGTYGDDQIATTKADIRQYVAPGAPGAPVISYSKNRLTVKEPWTYTWKKALQANTSSPVKGYRIRLYKNDKLIHIKDSSGKQLSVQNPSNSADCYYDKESNASSTINSFTIDPIVNGFKSGDTVKLGIYSYTRMGKDNDGAQIFNGKGNTEDQVNSLVSTVESAGIVHVKVDNEWKEGQVFVKVDGEWKEAESVSTKVNGSWEESN